MNAFPMMGDGDLVDLSNALTRERMDRQNERNGATREREYDPSWLPEVGDTLHGGRVVELSRVDLVYVVEEPSGARFAKNALLESAREFGARNKGAKQETTNAPR